MTTIRNATDNDATSLPAIERSAGLIFREIPDLAWIADEEDQSVERHLELIAKGTSWVAVDCDNRPIAFLAAEIQEDCLHVCEAAVHREHQNKGIGRALLQTAIEDAKLRGLPAVTLTTFRDVGWNEPFYRKLGFRILGNEEMGERLREVLRREVEHGLPENRRCAMRLDLTQTA